MAIKLRDIAVPGFGMALAPPQIPGATYEKRCGAAYGRAKCGWLVIYGDREHGANLAFLRGYDPRFEEALLPLGPGGRRVLVVGDEGAGLRAARRPAASFCRANLSAPESGSRIAVRRPCATSPATGRSCAARLRLRTGGPTL